MWKQFINDFLIVHENHPRKLCLSLYQVSCGTELSPIQINKEISEFTSAYAIQDTISYKSDFHLISLCFITVENKSSLFVKSSYNTIEGIPIQSFISNFHMNFECMKLCRRIGFGLNSEGFHHFILQESSYNIQTMHLPKSYESLSQLNVHEYRNSYIVGVGVRKDTDTGVLIYELNNSKSCRFMHFIVIDQLLSFQLYSVMDESPQNVNVLKNRILLLSLSVTGIFSVFDVKTQCKNSSLLLQNKHFVFVSTPKYSSVILHDSSEKKLSIVNTNNFLVEESLWYDHEFVIKIKEFSQDLQFLDVNLNGRKFRNIKPSVPSVEETNAIQSFKHTLVQRLNALSIREEQLRKSINSKRCLVERMTHWWNCRCPASNLCAESSSVLCRGYITPNQFPSLSLSVRRSDCLSYHSLVSIQGPNLLILPRNDILVLYTTFLFDLQKRQSPSSVCEWWRLNILHDNPQLVSWFCQPQLVDADTRKVTIIAYAPARSFDLSVSTTLHVYLDSSSSLSHTEVLYCGSSAFTVRDMIEQENTTSLFHILDTISPNAFEMVGLSSTWCLVSKSSSIPFHFDQLSQRLQIQKTPTGEFVISKGSLLDCRFTVLRRDERQLIIKIYVTCHSQFIDLFNFLIFLQPDDITISVVPTDSLREKQLLLEDCLRNLKERLLEEIDILSAGCLQLIGSRGDCPLIDSAPDLEGASRFLDEIKETMKIISSRDGVSKEELNALVQNWNSLRAVTDACVNKLL